MSAIDELPLRDRRHAGQVLARRLEHLRDWPRLIVLALPRGGVAVGFEVAQALRAPLDVFVVRKLGHPGHEEYAMGAIASGGVRVLNRDGLAPVPAAALEAVTERERIELGRRELLYRGDRPPLALEGRTVIVVDDGLATGATMRAAAQAIRVQRPHHLCIAVPVGPAETCAELRELADEVICAAMPSPFQAVGLWYRDFPQSSDEEVRDLLARANASRRPGT